MKLIVIGSDCNQLYVAMTTEGTLHLRTPWNKERCSERYYLTQGDLGL